MGNNACPVCELKTEGKAVRQVNFCRSHKDLAIYLRGSEEFKAHERRIGKTLSGLDFEILFVSFVRDADALLRKVGLRLRPMYRGTG